MQPNVHIFSSLPSWSGVKRSRADRYAIQHDCVYLHGWQRQTCKQWRVNKRWGGGGEHTNKTKQAAGLSAVSGSTQVFTIKIKRINWMCTQFRQGGVEKQTRHSLNKIWELLMICILMTHHHANQFVLWPQIADGCRTAPAHASAPMGAAKLFRGLHEKLAQRLA